MHNICLHIGHFKLVSILALIAKGLQHDCFLMPLQACCKHTCFVSCVHTMVSHLSAHATLSALPMHDWLPSLSVMVLSPSNLLFQTAIDDL